MNQTNKAKAAEHPTTDTSAAPAHVSQPELPFTFISDSTDESAVAALMKYANHSAMADFVRSFECANPHDTTLADLKQLDKLPISR